MATFELTGVEGSTDQGLNAPQQQHTAIDIESDVRPTSTRVSLLMI